MAFTPACCFFSGKPIKSCLLSGFFKYFIYANYASFMFDNNSNIDVGRWRRKRFLTKSLFVVVARFDDETFLMKGDRSDVSAHVCAKEIVV